MSNQTFREYTTSTAFAIQLSKLQCHALLLLEFRRRNPEANYMPLGVGVYHALEARGLVFWKRDGAHQKFGGLTKEGRLMCILLRRAGLTLENTVTLSVAKMMQRAAA